MPAKLNVGASRKVTDWKGICYEATWPLLSCPFGHSPLLAASEAGGIITHVRRHSFLEH